jgi:hypothetical protein
VQLEVKNLVLLITFQEITTWIAKFNLWFN